MFILYALVIGVALGIALGGRPAGLGSLRFRWSGLMLAGLMAQVVLFSDTVAERVGALGPPIYVASTVLVLAAVVANRSIPGMAIVALGAVSNLAAIVANGGYMPAARSALDALGKSDPTTYSNSMSVESPALGPLTDVFAMPPWLPFANVFSVGDVLIVVGVVTTIVLAMRSVARGGDSDRGAREQLPHPADLPGTVE
ncbi:MAG TPA: DUF5317 family protein [Candidatus Limnocylindrales bacterium]|nr:DUF5317 family protein [Candidatus Limnocylindrales bacterium]